MSNYTVPLLLTLTAPLPAAADALVHRQATFQFTAKAPMAQVAPLFGAERERVWSLDWNPKFIHPAPATDQRGMVFTVDHPHGQAIWVNTQLDLENGVIQYVYVIPAAMTTVITLRLTPQGKKTHVQVDYERTALSADANAHVRHLSDEDTKAGPQWEREINDYLTRPAAR